MKRYYSVLMVLAYILSAQGQEAVCSVAVADLLGQKTQETDPQQSYDQLIMDGPAQYVKRIDQLIFNERVTIMQECGNECHIRVPSHYYCTPTDPTLHNDYWTLRSNLVLLSTLDDPSVVPAATANSIICLYAPFHDYKYYRQYSFGTRFVLDDLQDSATYFRVRLFSKQLHTGHLYIPKALCIAPASLSEDEKIKQFVTLLDNLACPDNGCVAYVWGGNSHIKPYGHKRTVSTQTGAMTINASPVSHASHSGFDCSALIMRCAQTAGLPWHWRNSSAIKQHISPLAPHESLEPGDIIAIPGHIMVLPDPERAELLEARTFLHGYGCVHRIALNEEFNQINTVADLLACYRNNTAVTRLDAHGKPIATTHITLLKIRSIFNGAPGRI